MFENSINAKNGLIEKTDCSKYTIEYYDSFYKEDIIVCYETKEKRDADYKNLNNYSCDYKARNN